MFKLLKSKTTNAGFKKIKKIPKTLAEHLFLVFFGFLIIDLIIGSFVFYKYYLLIENSEVNISEKVLKFEENTYQEVLDQWQTREENLKSINSKEYFNPFQELRKNSLPTSTEEVIPIEESTSTEGMISTEEAVSAPPESPPPAPEQPEPDSSLNKEALLAARNLFEFFMIKDGKFPYFWERAVIWESKGFGSRDYYYGSEYQNILLLEALKKDLTK